jgi:hypothetical protein
MQFSPVSCYTLLLRPKYLPQTPFSNTLSLCSSLIVRDQVSHPCNRTGRAVLKFTTNSLHLLSKNHCCMFRRLTVGLAIGETCAWSAVVHYCQPDCTVSVRQSTSRTNLRSYTYKKYLSFVAMC